MGGFESSNHRLRSGRRLDLIAATGHDRLAYADYRRLRDLGICTARDAIRWTLIERRPGHYAWSSVLPMIRAARRAGVQVIWDLCHYGWPDDLDIWSDAFVDRLAGLARAFARLLAAEGDGVPIIVPVNEISFWSWAGGQVAYFPPFESKRGCELKRQLVRAAVAAIDAFWSVVPAARVLHVEPAIHIVVDRAHPDMRRPATEHYRSQYEAWDAIAGRLWPELGGREEYLDLVGVNYYFHNQWLYHNGKRLQRGDAGYRPFRAMLGDVYERYGRAMIVSETGTEDEDRPGWLRYISDEVCAAMAAGVPVQGICWYPIVNHPGWDDNRHVYNGLWDYADKDGGRKVYPPLARELRLQRRRFALSEHPNL